MSCRGLHGVNLNVFHGGSTGSGSGEENSDSAKMSRDGVDSMSSNRRLPKRGRSGLADDVSMRMGESARFPEGGAR
jgi:hypothetical protein